MVSKTNGKPKAAAHGCLTARHWKDIRQAMQLVRHEGVPLTVHGVTVGSTATTTEIRGPQKGKTADDSVRDGHKLAPAATADAARAGPSIKQQRDTLRAEENRARTACATRWLPFIHHVLRSDRAKSRGDVWTAHMKHRLALRDKMRDFFVSVWSQTARMRAHEDATTRLRLLLVRGKKCALACSARARWISNTFRWNMRCMFLDYKIMLDQQAAQALLHLASPCPELSPPGRRLASTRHMEENTPPANGDTKRPAAKKTGSKPRGGRSRRR